MLKNKQKILIADDSEINRFILADMLGDQFEILEAEDGEQAVTTLHKLGVEISLVLLDIVMPKMDGFEVLSFMNKYRLIDDVPVIMISSENSASFVERAYGMGATDYISRPFDAHVVRHRALNTIMLYAKQRRLIGLITDQIYEKQKSNSIMINILSYIVEFRNGESGLHVLHIGKMTDILLNRLVQKTDKYHLSRKDISLIGTASALHDIGKIAIPDEIINKPGRFTPEEFKIMQSHSAEGANLLERLPYFEKEPLVKVARDICRWHHERYDGKGYPDGLKGEEIPISAQVVSIADVYDALTSERVYKKAYSHERSIEMIFNGECGAFNPLLLECLMDVSQEIQEEVHKEPEGNALIGDNRREMQKIAEEMVNHEELAASERTLQLLEHERLKYQFFASMAQEIQFEFTAEPPMLNLSEWGASRLGVDELIMNPLKSRQLTDIMDAENLEALDAMLHSSNPDNPVVQFDCQIKVNGELRWHHVIARALWSSEDPPQFRGSIGKVVDTHNDHMRTMHIKHMASQDALTGLMNPDKARAGIRKRLLDKPGEDFALAVFEVYPFKTNGTKKERVEWGQMLKYTAERLRHNIQNGDITARLEGDRFIAFFEYQEGLSQVIERIFNSLSGTFGDYTVSVNMGIATTENGCRNFEELLKHASAALEDGKSRRGGQYSFYDEHDSGSSGSDAPEG